MAMQLKNYNIPKTHKIAMQLLENTYNIAFSTCDKLRYYEPINYMILNLVLRSFGFFFIKSVTNCLEKLNGFFLRLVKPSATVVHIVKFFS